MQECKKTKKEIEPDFKDTLNDNEDTLNDNEDTLNDNEDTLNNNDDTRDGDWVKVKHSRSSPQNIQRNQYHSPTSLNSLASYPNHFQSAPQLYRTSSQSYPPPETYHQRYKRKDKYKPAYYPSSKHPVFCSNCGGKGHLFKECKKPIQSHGVIAVRPFIDPSTNQKSIEVLLIRRKNTISYEAFVRGKYKHDELPIHLVRMTSEEKERITKKEWEELYDEVCYYKNSKHYFREKRHAKEMYDSLDIPSVFDTTDSEFESPEWEFPKGRKYSFESEKQCAVREFREETNIDNKNLVLIDIVMKESFIGTNKRKYMNQYFVGVVNREACEPYIDPNSKNQVSEIGEVEWVDFEEAKSRIRSFHPQKVKILDNIYEKLIKRLDFIDEIHSKSTNELNDLYTNTNYKLA